MNRLYSMLAVAFTTAWLGTSIGAEAPTRTALHLAVEESRATGIATIPAHEEFFRKTREGQIETLSNIWKLLEARGATPTRLEIVRSGTTIVVMRYSPRSGLVAVR